jgi:signal transduction histidine kinase
MLRLSFPRTSTRPGRGLVILFALTVLTPGLLLAAIGVRAYSHERRFIAQQLRERADHAAERAAAEVERELREWTSALAGLDVSRPLDIRQLPALWRFLIDEPGALVVIATNEQDGERRTTTWPPRQVLYQIDGSAAEANAAFMPADAIVQAENIEIRDKDYARAIGAYRRLLPGAGASDRVELLHRMARTYRKAGRDVEATRTLEAMASSSEPVGHVPADLIAAFELETPRLYRDLVEGRWVVDRSRYAFYADTARAWIPAGERSRLVVIEGRKRRLTEAAAEVLEGRLPSGFLVWPRSTPAAASPRSRVLLASERLESAVWPAVLGKTLQAGFDVRLQTESKQPVFRSAVRPAAASALSSTRSLNDAEGGWQVSVWPRDPGALGADLERRQTVYLVMLVLVVGLLAFGTYVTTRVTRREIEVARLKADFVSTVSHEFRSPLAGIRQLGELLLRGRVPSEERRREYYERITAESDRLSRLVENLLDFARMEDNRKTYRFEPLDAVPWLRNVVANVEPEYARRGIAIATDIDEALPPLMADPEALASAVQNLIDNAVKYSPGRDTIWLQAHAANSHVTIRVRDEGVGISDEDRLKVFDKFYRGDAEITSDVKGAGLGLSLVRHIVAAHGGTVECASRLGEGSTFSIHLPCRASS